MKLLNFKKLVFAIFIFLCIKGFTQAPFIEWQNTFGTGSKEIPKEILQTSDNGFLLLGTQYKDIDVEHMLNNIWLLKISPEGKEMWSKSYGGESTDLAYFLLQARNQEFLIIGITDSKKGDIRHNYGDFDYWIIKINSNGDTLWTKTYGGSGLDEPFCVKASKDGGFVILGNSRSKDGDLHPEIESSQNWLLKINQAGKIESSKLIRNIKHVNLTSFDLTSDGGFLTVGYNNLILSTSVICKLNMDGDTIWTKTFPDFYFFQNVMSTENGFTVTGTTKNNPGNGYHGEFDYWFGEFSENGNIMNSKCYGGSRSDELKSSLKLIDNGFLLIGQTTSNDNDFSDNHGDYDIGIIKIDKNGNLQWSKCFGGNSSDFPASSNPLSDGGYILSGKIYSGGGDIRNYDGKQTWVVKLIDENFQSIADDYRPELNIVNSIIVHDNQLQIISNEFRRLMIVDISGTCLYSTKNKTINLSFLASGIYFSYCILKTGKVEVSKVIKL